MAKITETEKAVSVNLVTQKFFGPEVGSAIQALESGIIPLHAIKSHPGKGGKVFKYVSHIWVTQQLQLGLNHFWGYETSNPIVWDDGSASAMVTLNIKIPMPDGTFLTQTFTCTGCVDGSNNMPKAYRIASAESRGLVRCCMRAFGIGMELYEEEEEITPEKAWNILLQRAIQLKIEKPELVALFKNHNITQGDLIDKFEQCWKMVNDFGAKDKPESVPSDFSDITTDPAVSQPAPVAPPAVSQPVTIPREEEPEFPPIDVTVEAPLDKVFVPEMVAPPVAQPATPIPAYVRIAVESGDNKAIFNSIKGYIKNTKKDYDAAIVVFKANEIKGDNLTVVYKRALDLVDTLPVGNYTYKY